MEQGSKNSRSKGRSSRKAAVHSLYERGEAWCEGEGNFLDNVYRE